MSDDLDRSLRERLSSVQFPAAPPSLHAAFDRLEGETAVPERAPVRRRAFLPAVPVLLLTIATVALVAWGNGFRLGEPSSIGATAWPDNSQPLGSSTPASLEPSVTPGRGVDLTAVDNGLTMTVTLDGTEVVPGGSVAIEVTIRNDRTVPVVLAVGYCGAPATMHALVPVPVDPSGRDWNGIAAKFKQFALTEGYREGVVPFATPGWIYGTVEPCLEGGSNFTLSPGETASTSLTWTAALVKDVPALPGEIAFTVSAAHDPTGEPPSYPPEYKGPLATWWQTYQQLTVEGRLRIAGDAPTVLTAGQALDALLTDGRFTTWLAEKPVSTWSGVNMFLQNNGKAEGIVPAGPSWEIDLFREAGVPRNWAIGFVDPFTGELLNLSFCNDPCDR